MKLNIFIIIITAIFLLHGCLTASILGTSAIAIKSFSDPRTIGRQIDDMTLTLNVNGMINKNKEIAKYSNVNVTAYKGIILLTGQSLNIKLIRLISYIVKTVEGVEIIYNEIRLDNKITLKTAIYDSMITALIKLKIFNSKIINLSSIKVITENHEVFLLGVVTKSVGAKVAKIASETHGVKLVTTIFSYIDK
uniref:Division/outer membrane stress-associated lipid-binding lipoprotein n=1 Tax=Candidatus Aschnera chinzeii TaxID=1485666 RepID=A0AAT9G564_9ENTR|nr:MAG: division/outer membrane stress-associated lipid-binding lipoprotein [Candidatus Aschnera chinzeii]